jgi:hypothetical protein
MNDLPVTRRCDSRACFLKLVDVEGDAIHS